MRRRQRGQALIELAIIFPVILLVFLGAWTGAALIANNDSVAQATGYGARIAAEIGSTCGEQSGSLTCEEESACQTTADDPCAVDEEILSAMLPSLNQLSNSTPTMIEIYQPASCMPAGGVLPALSTCSVAQGDPAGATEQDDYTYCSTTGSWNLDGTDGASASGGSGCFTGGTGEYALNLRAQTVDDEEAIGVAVWFHFTSPGLAYYSQTDSSYTAITFPPEGS